MLPMKFPAVLKTGDGKFLEFGYAQADLETQSVEFWNEFVPLLPMGEPAVIVRILENREAHVFSGQVYLSSSGLLRLVSVQDRVLEPELELPVDTALPALVSVAEEPPPPPRLPFRRRSGAPKLPSGELEATIYVLSKGSLTFRCSHSFPVGQRLLLRTPSTPLLEGTEVEVEQILAFGVGTIGHKCAILSLSPEDRENLNRFIRRVSTLFSSPREDSEG